MFDHSDKQVLENYIYSLQTSSSPLKDRNHSSIRNENHLSSCIFLFSFLKGNTEPHEQVLLGNKKLHIYIPELTLSK